MSKRLIHLKDGLRVRLFGIMFVAISIGMITISPLVCAAVSATNRLPSRSIQSIAVTPLAPTGNYFDHVVVIMMENEGVGDICGGSIPPCSSSHAPFLSSLANNYTLATQQVSLITTSQPNYVALLSGSMQGCNDSGCPFPSGLGLGSPAPNLVDRFESTGLTWRGYFENMTAGTGCNAALDSAEPYTSIHNPFVWFQDITNSTARCNRIVNANPNSCGNVTDCVLVNDLNNETNPAPNFMWLTPDDCNDMRGNSVCTGGCGVVVGTCISSGDAYLSKIVSSILKSLTFTTSRSALYIGFDEGNGFCPLTTGGYYPDGTSEDCVLASWSGPAAKTHFSTTHLYTQYSVAKTLETNWNLASFTANDTNAIPMTEFFKNTPADFTIQPSPTFSSNNRINPNTAVIAGVKTNTTFLLTSTNNFTGTVNYTATSAPAGPTLTFSPTSTTLTAQGTVTPTIIFNPSTAGTYSVTITAASGSLSHNTTITFDAVPPDFALSASPGSLTIGQISTSANAPVTVNSTGDQKFFQSSYLRTSFYAQGRIWLFYEDTRYTCEHLTGCLFYTSSTNGTKWALATNAGIHITNNDFSVYTNGTSIFYARYNETSFDSQCGRKLQFGLGNLNPTGTINWQLEQNVFTGAPNRTYPNEEITVDSNGQVWIAYLIDNNGACGGTGTERPVIIHSAGTNYASWTGNMTLCLAACHSLNWHISLASLPNGQVYSLYWVSKFGVHGRPYNGTAWGSEETISTDTTDVNNWLFNNPTNIYAIYFDNNTETYNFATRSSTGSWTINLIGSGEAHSGSLAFSSSYYALPDSASYDSKDNLFDLFYMNGTTQSIDQWSGSGTTWTKTTGLISPGAVPYPDSISSFIQSSSTPIGVIFYTSGATSFTINSAVLKFNPPGNTGSLKITVAGLYGFTGTVSLTTTTSPSNGLTVNCNPSTIPNGSGSSTCNLTASTKGTYNITITGTNNTLTHSIKVKITVLTLPGFTVTTTEPSPADVSQNITATITVTSLNGFAGTVSLTDTVPTGLTCNPIIPGSITGSGATTVSCTASKWGNYTLTVTGTSGSLSNSTSVMLSFQDFNLTATTPIDTIATATFTANITITSFNQFRGRVNFTDTIPSGWTCGPVTPSNVNGSGVAFVTCRGPLAGNYTLSITGTSGSIVHTFPILVRLVTNATGGISLPVDKLRLLTQFVQPAAIGMLGLVVSTAVLVSNRRKRNRVPNLHAA